MVIKVNIGNTTIGGGKLALIAGPCVIESREICLHIGTEVKAICNDLDIPYIFKASFDKANRTSVKASRGPGMDEGLAILAEMRSTLGVPVLTDVHEGWQCEKVAAVVDVLQIPAFLCRQTDLLIAAAQTGKPVNVKKGQFLSPYDMKNIAEKVVASGNDQVMLTERGTTFGYGNLVVDMRGLQVMRDFGHPVILDATHSVQRPGGLGTASGGDPEFVPALVRAACAVGIDALFLEVHPQPEKALSDAATMLHLNELRSVLEQAMAIHEMVTKMI